MLNIKVSSLGYRNLRLEFHRGQCLGPFCFLILLMMLCSVSSSNCLLYADDLKICRIIDFAIDCELLQTGLNMLHQWCTTNSLVLNKDKCRNMTFSRKQNTIVYHYEINKKALNHCDTFRDFCVIFGSKLTFNNHGETFCKLLDFLARNTRDLNNQALVIFFNAYIRSKLE